MLNLGTRRQGSEVRTDRNHALLQLQSLPHPHPTTPPTPRQSLKSMTSTSPSTSPSRPSFNSSPSIAGHATLIDFLHKVPAPLTTVLLSLSSPIARVRWLLEVLSWKRPYSESWLSLAGWWALCLLSEFTFRFVLKCAVFLRRCPDPHCRYLLVFIAAGAYLYAAHRQQVRRNKPPVTEETLQAVIVDLSVIESTLPSPERPPIPSWPILLRVIAILYIPAVILTTFVRLKVIVGIIGTIVLTWRAPWARNLRAAIMRSAWVRWVLYQLWARISGQPYERKDVVTIASQEHPPSHTIRFLFTVYENQRWWMGLDWTSALLPSERPPWCSATFEHLAPPSSFALPPKIVTFVSDGSGGTLRRAVSWSWEESEWKVLIKREQGVSKRVERDLPNPNEATPSQSKIDKTKQKIKETAQKTNPVKLEDGGQSDEHHDDGESDNEETHDMSEPLTDHDGWVYGDNQWKALSNKGGLGKVGTHEIRCYL